MNTKALINFILALAVALPATLLVATSSAAAGPGALINSASKDGKRKHKRANAKRTKKKSKKKKTSRSSTRRSSSNHDGHGVRRTTTRRNSHGHTTRRNTRTTRRTTRTRTVRRPAHHTTRRTTTRRRVTHTAPRHRHVRHTRHHNTRTRTRVVHTQSSSTQASSRASSGSTASSSSNIEAYLTGGLGYSGFAAPTITDEALPGAGYNLALGIKGKYLGVEFGFNGSGHTFDPEAATTDLAVFGLSADLKIQPSFAFFEPYILGGIGGYSLQDGVINEASAGAALRLGAGADFRFDDAAIGVRYLHSQYGFADDSGIYGGDFGASSETLGVNLSFYF